MNGILPMTPAPPSVLDGATTALEAFAAEYGGQVVVVIGLAVAIGLGIWGFLKLVGLFRKSAK